ncbi:MULTISPECIES: AMP-binding enzyme [Bradyrhizobium]|uniref:AMP-binding enzyme n=1 Tax=Bradyrhizobium elkanii TaxID=29448 RepID=UPI003D1F6227
MIEAAVFPIPHERLGADVVAAIVRHQDAKVNLQSVRDFARGRLAGFKVPGLILIEPEIRKALNLLRMSGHL